MKKFSFKGIYWRIFFTFLATSLLATLVTLAYAVAFRQLSNDTANLIAPTEGYISSAELVLQRGGEPLLMEWLISMENYPHVNAYVFDQSGNNLLGAEIPEDVQKYAFARDEYNAQIQPLSTSEVLVKAPLTSLSGEYYLLVVELVHPFVIEGVHYYMLLGLGISIVLFALITSLLSRYLTRPIFSLKKSMRLMKGGELGVRPKDRLLKRQDEIGDLSREFYNMAHRVEQLVEDQKLLLRDVSHELRSPLARLQVANELARLDADEGIVNYLDRIELESNRLNEMIGDLLELAKLEVSNQFTYPETDLVKLVDDICHDARFEQQQENICFDTNVDTSFIHAEAKMLTSALENIIRNALLHTAKGTQVEVFLHQLQGKVCVTIRDHGTGVDEKMIPHLTKPFYRAEDARERKPEDEISKKHRGFGLGLSIAYRTVKYFNGEMKIRNHPAGGLEIECCFYFNNSEIDG